MRNAALIATGASWNFITESKIEKLSVIWSASRLCLLSWYKEFRRAIILSESVLCLQIYVLEQMFECYGKIKKLQNISYLSVIKSFADSFERDVKGVNRRHETYLLWKATPNDLMCNFLHSWEVTWTFKKDFENNESEDNEI